MWLEITLQYRRILNLWVETLRNIFLALKIFCQNFLKIQRRGPAAVSDVIISTFKIMSKVSTITTEPVHSNT